MCQIQPDGSRRMVAAASRSLLDAETGYAAIEKVALGVCWAMDKSSSYILGMADLVIEVDHKPLFSLLANMFMVWLPLRIRRFKLRPQRSHYFIRHISSKDNSSADALSQYTVISADEEDPLLIEDVERHVGEKYS